MNVKYLEKEWEIICTYICNKEYFLFMLANFIRFSWIEFHCFTFDIKIIEFSQNWLLQMYHKTIVKNYRLVTLNILASVRLVLGWFEQ